MAATSSAVTMPAALAAQKLAAAGKKEKNQHIQVVVRCRSDSWHKVSLSVVMI